VGIDETGDRLLQVIDRLEDAAANLVLCQEPEEALDLIDPRGREVLLNRPDSAARWEPSSTSCIQHLVSAVGLLSIFVEVKAFTRVSLGAAVAGAQSYPGATASSPP
jgi:hypothetical protein